MRPWFCEVGGTIRASRIVPSASIAYLCQSSPRAATGYGWSEARGGTSIAGGSGGT